MGINVHKDLPSEYQELRYIESSGTQYIDTGVSAPNGFKSQLKICITGQVGQTLIGSHNVNSPYGRNNINTYTSGATWGLHMNDEMINGLGSIVIGQDCEIEMSTILGASYLTVDGIRLTNGTNTSPMSTNNILILQNQYGIAHGDSCNKAKIYYCKIYDSSETLVRDFVPCYRKSDDEIGLYDLVNGVFYTNQGTGTFIKGPEPKSSGKVKRILIWQNGVEKQVYPGIVTITDNFSGTTLNSDIRSTENDGGSISVNNGLILSAGNNSCAVYTKATYKGTEKKITAEYTISSEGGTYIECYRGFLYEVGNYIGGPIVQCMSTWQGGSSRIMIRTGSGSWDYAMSLGRTAAPYTVKLEIDCVNNTYTSRINGTQQYTGSLQYALSNFVGCPYFFASVNTQNKTTTLNSFKLTVEL